MSLVAIVKPRARLHVGLAFSHLQGRLFLFPLYLDGALGDEGGHRADRS